MIFEIQKCSLDRFPEEGETEGKSQWNFNLRTNCHKYFILRDEKL